MVSSNRGRVRPRRALGVVIASSLVSLTACSAAQPAVAPSSDPATQTSTLIASPTSVTTPTVSSTSTSPSATQTASGFCATKAAKLTLEQQVAQLYMMGITETAPGNQTALAGRLQVGSVILMTRPAQGSESTRTLTTAIQSAAGDTIPVLMAADQEGGLVQRLRGDGFSTIPAATVQSQWSTDKLEDAWAGYGKQMVGAGVRYDLAPIADIVSATNPRKNAPIGALNRQYGTSSKQAAPRIAAVIRGLDRAGVASSAKHFPGLGAVQVNTDFGTAVDTTTTASSDAITAFADAIKAGVPSVMVSSSVYAKIDADTPAVFSQRIVTGLLRTKLGFTGVIISDDLGSAQAVADMTAPTRGTRFLRAGGDLVINVNPATVASMIAHTTAQARKDAAFADDITAKVGRVLTMKDSTGLYSCSASD